jgi:glycine cleavage system H lipoate-binding protein
MEFMATKGIEYLMAIGYLLLLIPFWWLVARETGGSAALGRARALDPARAMRSWFAMPDGLHFHRGHAWAAPEADGVFRVGIDDFAQRLVGRADAVDLPRAGTLVEAGAPGLNLRFDGHAVKVLSPVGGEVVATNPAVREDTRVLCDDPYGKGWLMKVRVPRTASALSNLLSGRAARAWMDDAAESLSTLMGPKLGPVLQDGGVPVSGFARELSPEGWRRIAEELLLTS